MSATGRGGQRLADDYYVTPAKCVHAILPHLLTGRPIVRPQVIEGDPPPRKIIVIDPCAGDGAILRTVRDAIGKANVETKGVELDAQRAAFAQVKCGDSLAMRQWPYFDLCVMNPPFSNALPFVQRALSESWRNSEVAVLMRLAMLAGKERRAFWKANPADVYVLAQRPNFTEPLRWRCALGGKPCGKRVEHTRSGVCRRPEGHTGECMTCGTDASEYAWFVWGHRRGGHWARLECV